MKEALWWEITDNNRILCTLCPRYCTLGEGQKGFCFIRENIGGKLYSTGYGRPTGFGLDPIEKKPLNHFYPGSTILSFGTAGCNLGCKFCQNWTSSKAKLDEVQSYKVTPENVIELAKENNAESIAFTYNDPTIFGEFVIDVSKLARQEGIKTVMVTAGYIDKNARKDVYKYIDAANVDLKAFTEEFYFKLTSSHLADVLDTINWLVNDTDIWTELTTLLIPGENDSTDEIRELSKWVVNNLGKDVPLHFTAFHPDFKMREKPRTSLSTLQTARETALKEGANYVYLGNIVDREGHTTYCPDCNSPLIVRDWHSIKINRIPKGICPVCNKKIAGVF